MILAAPLVIPFAKAVGLSVGALGMAALADQVNEYIQENPEESMKILSTIIPGAGIGQIFMSKEDKISLEDLDEMTDEEAQDLSKEEKAELMKQAGKSGGPNKRQTMIDISEKLGLSGEGKEKQDIEYDIDERYDEGGVEEVSKPKFDYKKFFRNRRADGGRIGFDIGGSVIDKVASFFFDEEGSPSKALQRAKFEISKFLGGMGTDLDTGAEWYDKLEPEEQREIIKEKMKYRERGELGGVPVYDEKYAGKFGIGGNYANGGAIGIEVLFREKKNLGGLLTGQAKSIYDNMTAAGYFTEDEIKNAIIGAGYEIPDAASTPAPDTGIIGAQLNNNRGSTPIGAPSSLVSGFKTATQERQNRLTNPNKAIEFFNKFTGGGQRDIGEMIRSGEVDQRKLAGIPTVGNIIGKALPDSYYNMSLGDQVFTQAMSGYTGPTVFGENLGNQDPFGLNVRSGFGNYAEAVGKDFASLRESLTGRLADKYGVEFDEETGMFVGKNAALANKMTNMMRTKFNFRKDQLAAKNKLDAQIKAAEEKRKAKEIADQKAIQEAATRRTYSLQDLQDSSDRGTGQSYAAARARTASRVGPGGNVRAYGLKDGGLASMFVEKR